MAPVRNSQVLFNEPPSGFPEPGRHTTFDGSQTIDLDTVPLNGGLLLKTLVLGIDPVISALMKSVFKPGDPISSYGVAIVLRTENTAVKVGDHVYGLIPDQEYSVVPDVKMILNFRILENKENIPWSVYVGLAGLAGQTAYMGWKEYASPKKGDVVFVTTASGPVGSCVVQLAKQEGLKVIASASSDEKVKFLKQIGVDVAFNYKTTSTEEVLKKEGPINIYWDNVGGEMLDAALGNAARGARFIECGMIAIFHGQRPAMKNMFNIILSEINIHGYIASTLMPKYNDQFYAEIPKLVAEGKFQYFEERRKGLEHAEQALVDVLTGKNVGKMVITVGEDA